MKHGTCGYRKGCRCDVCVSAKHESYLRYKPKRKNARWQGRNLNVDAVQIQAALDRDGRTPTQFCADIGIHENTLEGVLYRGTASECTLDLIACGLSMHMSQLEVSCTATGRTVPA